MEVIFLAALLMIGIPFICHLNRKNKESKTREKRERLALLSETTALLKEAEMEDMDPEERRDFLKVITKVLKV